MLRILSPLLPFTLPLLIAILPAPALAGQPPSSELGIGFGWQLNAFGDSAAPNTGSLRLRLPSGLTLEPSVAFGVADRGYDQQTDVNLGGSLTLRVPLASRRRVQLAFLGSAAGNRASWTGDEVTQNFWAARVGWGLGVELRASEHVAISTDAIASVVSWANEGGVANTVSWGPFFAPNYRVMVHLYF